LLSWHISVVRTRDFLRVNSRFFFRRFFYKIINMPEWYPLTSNGRFFTWKIRKVRSSDIALVADGNLARIQKQPLSSVPQSCALAEHLSLSLSLSLFLFPSRFSVRSSGKQFAKRSRIGLISILHTIPILHGGSFDPTWNFEMAFSRDRNARVRACTRPWSNNRTIVHARTNTGFYDVCTYDRASTSVTRPKRGYVFPEWESDKSLTLVTLIARCELINFGVDFVFRLIGFRCNVWRQVSYGSASQREERFNIAILKRLINQHAV